MAETDSPLKDLLREFAPDFAAWLLNVARADIRDVHQETIELPAGMVFSDTVYHVTLANGQRPLLHVEFQGERSERPMRWRMLDYMSRLAQLEELVEGAPLCSAVIYVGDGAGVRDTGDYRLLCADWSLSLAWHYRVIRLWQMRAEELLALGRPALLPLVGQTRIEKPAEIIPAVVATIGRVEDFGWRASLFSALTSLLRDEEVVQMTERLIEAMSEGLLTDTPYLRRMRERGRIEGRDEGRDEGIAIGRAEGRAEGHAEGLNIGLTTGLTTAIMKVLTTRFDFPARTYLQLEQRLRAISDANRLQSLLQTAILTSDFASFEQTLAG